MTEPPEIHVRSRAVAPRHGDLLLPPANVMAVFRRDLVARDRTRLVTLLNAVSARLTAG
jgi:hypothetical protein